MFNMVKGNKEAGRLNSYSILRQPAITKFGRSVTPTRRSSHSFATETGLPYNPGCLGVAHIVSGYQTKVQFAWFTLAKS